MSHVLGMLHIEKEAKEDLEKMLLSAYAPRRKSLQWQLGLCGFSFLSASTQGHVLCRQIAAHCGYYHHARWRRMQHEHAAKEIMALPQNHAQMESDALQYAPVDNPF